MTTEQLSKLTPEEKRIRIAEACGMHGRFVIIKRRRYYRAHGSGYTDRISEAWVVDEAEARRHDYPHDEPVTHHPAPMPDYLNDLDAIHEAEKTLTPDLWNSYVNHLEGLIEAEDQPERDFRWMTAAAAQRADAFLLTLP